MSGENGWPMPGTQNPRVMHTSTPAREWIRYKQMLGPSAGTHDSAGVYDFGIRGDGMEKLENAEQAVGAKRMQWQHLLRVDTGAREVYILHSIQCLQAYGPRLPDCPVSQALDKFGADGLETDVVLSVIVDDDGGLAPNPADRPLGTGMNETLRFLDHTVKRVSRADEISGPT